MKVLNESRMPEMGTSGLTSGEWKRSVWWAIQAPATERVGLSYGSTFTSPRYSSTLQMLERGCVVFDQPQQALEFSAGYEACHALRLVFDTAALLFQTGSQKFMRRANVIVIYYKA